MWRFPLFTSSVPAQPKALSAPEKTLAHRLRDLFAVAARASFCRTLPYRHVDAPQDGMEWLKAVEDPDTLRWIVLKVNHRSDAKGMPSESQKMVKEKLTFLEMIECLSSYEATQADMGFEPAPFDRNTAGLSYFRALAEEELIAFDRSGAPHVTLSGRLVTDGDFEPGLEDRLLQKAGQKKAAVKMRLPVPSFNRELHETTLARLLETRRNIEKIRKIYANLNSTAKIIEYYRTEYKNTGRDLNEFAAIFEIDIQMIKNFREEKDKELNFSSGLFYQTIQEARALIDADKKLYDPALRAAMETLLIQTEMMFEICRANTSLRLLRGADGADVDQLQKMHKQALERVSLFAGKIGIPHEQTLAYMTLAVSPDIVPELPEMTAARELFATFLKKAQRARNRDDFSGKPASSY